MLPSTIIVGMTQDERDAGATSVEYALMASLIAGAIAGAVLLFGQAVVDLFVVPFP